MDNILIDAIAEVIRENNVRLESKFETRIKSLEERLEQAGEVIDQLSHKSVISAHEPGEVVREGSLRRFGLGAVFQALKDTAKSADESPEDWRLMIDGFKAPETTDSGVSVKTYGGFESEIKHGMAGEVGQRGKTGPQGLRGDDGIGVEAVEVTDTGIAIVLTTGKAVGLDFSKAMAQAIDDVGDIIEAKVKAFGGSHV